MDLKKMQEIIDLFDPTDPSQVRLTALTWGEWYDHFLKPLKTKHFGTSTPIDFFQKYDSLIKNSNGSEEDFKKAYPDLTYDQYVSPWAFNPTSISDKRVQEIAFLLQEHLPIDFDILCYELSSLYRGYKKENWTVYKLGFWFRQNPVTYEIGLKIQIALQLDSYINAT